MQVSSSALEILRTPMPFGSPVPDPARTTNLAQALGDAAGQKRPASGPPVYTNLPYTVPIELRCPFCPSQHALHFHHHLCSYGYKHTLLAVMCIQFRA